MMSNLCNTGLVDAAALEGASIGAFLWKKGGQVYLTLVIKASFVLSADEPMSLITPDALCPDEQPSPQGRGLYTGGDMAPYLGQAEYWMVGHARGGPASADGSLRVHVGVMRDRALIYEKNLSLSRDFWVEEAGGFFLGGWGPISRHWPARARYLGPAKVLMSNDGCLEIPDELDTAYFQSSSPDQRLPPLRGDEWLLMRNVFRSEECLRTRLPSVWGAARIFSNSGGSSGGSPVRMILDTLQIDTDRRVASLLWRGQWPISSMEVLPSLCIRGGIDRLERRIHWGRVLEKLPPVTKVVPVFSAVPSAKPEASAKASLLEGTMAMPEDLALRLLEMPVIPFTGTSMEPRVESPGALPLSGLPFLAPNFLVPPPATSTELDVPPLEQFPEPMDIAADMGLGDIFLSIMREVEPEALSA